MHKVIDALHTLASQRSRPLSAYFYDLEQLRRHAQWMHACLPANCELFYAAKANPEPQILNTLCGIVDGFEAASGGELQHLAQHLPGQKLIFGGPGKLDDELRVAMAHGVEFIHVESLHEIQRIQTIAAQQGIQQDILLRMNIDISGVELTRLAMGGRPTPFGIDENQFEAALALLSQCDHITLRGIHFHLMSHQLSELNHLKLIRLYLQKFNQWQQRYQLPIDHLNVGGGIGINYQQPDKSFDWASFCRRLEQLISAEQMDARTIRFECGRYMTAACGYYVVEVLDIKNNFGEDFVICRGGTHQFRTPAAQNHDHPFTVVKGANRIAASALHSNRVTLVGQLCTPKDVLARQQPVDEIAIGDYVIFPLAGAYAWNISHQNFLMHEPPDFCYL